MNGIKYFAAFIVIALFGLGLYIYIQQKEKVPEAKNGDYKISFEEKLLAVLPPDIKEEELNKHVFSPDGRSVAYILKKGNKLAIVVNDSTGPEYDDVGPPQFSPDGSMLAYKAKADSMWFMVTGDIISEKYDDIDYPLFSPDGKKISYAAKEGNKWFVVIDNIKSEKYDKVEALSFSPDSKRFAYRGNLEDEKKSLIIIDGKPGDKYEWVTEPRFSSDSKRVVYSAREEEKWLMVIDEKKSEKYDAVGIPVFSPDGKRLAYGAREGDSSVVVIDDKKSEKYDGVWNPHYSPNSKRVAYFAKEDNKWFVVVDNKRSEGYNDDSDPASFILSRMRPGMPNIPIGVPIFSPDSKRLGYWAKEGNKRHMVIDGKKSEGYDDISIPNFSPDGKRVAYGVKEGDKWFMIVNEEKYSALYGIIPKEIPIDKYSIKVTRENVIVFSTSMDKTAYICLTDKGYCVAVNDKISEEYDLIGGAVVNNGLGIVFRIHPSEGSLTLDGLDHLGTSLLSFGSEYSGTPYLHVSSDGKKLAFGARKGRELWWKVIDIEG
ncbi:MAG: hypothetical protein R6W90_11015 [Ignavibacteriaceae bacterium]